MKKRVPVIINPNDYKIICLILEKKDYNEILAKELNVKPSTVIEQLQYLQKQGFITSKKEKKKFNRKIYSVNFTRIANEFVTDLTNEFIEHAEKLSPYIENDLKQEEINKIKKIRSDLQGNKVLEDMLLAFFTAQKVNSSFEDSLILLKRINTLRDMFVLITKFLRNELIYENVPNPAIKKLFEDIAKLFKGNSPPKLEDREKKLFEEIYKDK